MTQPAEAVIAGRRIRLASPATATAVAVVILLLAAALVPLLRIAGQDVLSNVSQDAPFLPVAAVGLVVARHQPRNPIGWLLLATAAGALLSADAAPYAWLVYRRGQHLPFAPVAAGGTGVPQLVRGASAGAAALPGRRAALAALALGAGAYFAVVACLVVSAYAVVVTVLLAHHVRLDASGDIVALDHPSGSTAWLSHVVTLTFPALVAFWLVFAGRLLLSWRRAGGERRQQLKWLLTGAAVSLACGVIGVGSGVFDPHAPRRSRRSPAPSTRPASSPSRYGPTIKELIHEEFGDGIMSAINFRFDVSREPDPAGDRVVVTLNGKFLPYQW